LLDIFDDVDDKLFLFNTLFTDVLNLHAPIKTVRVKRNCTPWISRTVRSEMDKRNKLHKTFLSSRSTSSWEEYKRQRNLVVSLQRKAKIDYFHRILSNDVSQPHFDRH
jgi:hypothetical protein